MARVAARIKQDWVSQLRPEAIEERLCSIFQLTVQQVEYDFQQTVSEQNNSNWIETNASMKVDSLTKEIE